MTTNHVGRRRQRGDAGALLLEVLIAIVITAAVAAFAVSSVRGSMQKNHDLAVQQDLRNYSKAAEAYFVRHSRYPTTDTGWSMRGHDPASPDGFYQVDVYPDGPQAGYVIWGKDKNAADEDPWTWVLSSYGTKKPEPADDGPGAVPSQDPTALQW